jgi:hypothetical protein
LDEFKKGRTEFGLWHGQSARVTSSQRKKNRKFSHKVPDITRPEVARMALNPRQIAALQLARFHGGTLKQDMQNPSRDLFS